MDSTAISADGVRKAFGGPPVLDGFDLEVRAGTVCALLGPNGAGKTTAVRILTTLLRPDGGRVEVAGVDVAASATRGTAPDRAGRVSRPRSTSCWALGRTSCMFARLHHLDRRAARRRADELLAQFGLAGTGRRAGPRRSPAGCAAASTSPRG